MQTEFIRSLQSNYARILLEEAPEEKRYQYCILSRGGIKGLLSCSLRYIDGQAYLYYDISSMQNIAQLYEKRLITREWLKDFMWSFKNIRQELERFLLDEGNLLWYPGQIFQDLQNRNFSFLYIPYYDGESGFLKLLEFLVEHIDYEDEGLVECVYKMYEQFEQNGEVYLQGKIFEDMRCLEEEAGEKKTDGEGGRSAEAAAGISDGERRETEDAKPDERAEKRGLFRMLEAKRKKSRDFFGGFVQGIDAEEKKGAEAAKQQAGYVAEESVFEEYGKTVYIEEQPEERKRHRLYTAAGRIAAELDKPVLTIGKKKEEADLVLEDASVSRLHARILAENEELYLEDMNSTNGTYKNGLRLQPYEKRRLEEQDEIRFGKLLFIYR